MTEPSGPREESADLLVELAPDEIALIDHYLGRTTFESGQIPLRAGERDRALYFLREGTLEVVVGKGEGDVESRAGVVNVLEAPSVLGEVSFFDGEVRSASVRAITAGSMDRLSWESFVELSSRNPKLGVTLAVALGATLARRLRAAEVRKSR